MSLIVQNDSGSQTGANGYITVAFFRSYHDDRCNASISFDTKQIEGAIVRATDHVDQRFRFVGEKQNGQSQTTAWPRLDAEDIDDDVRSNVPQEVKEGTKYLFVGAPKRIRASDLRIRRPRRDTVNLITSKTWVYRTRQKVPFRGPKTHSIP